MTQRHNDGTGPVSTPSDEEHLVGRILSRIKNNRVLALLIVLGLVVIAVGSFTDAVQSTLQFLGLPSTVGSGALEVTSVRFTHDSEFDVTVRNRGGDAAVINRIAITMLEDHEIAVKPILEPTARYYLPVDGMKTGETRSIDVDHVIDAHKADRFLIALDTTAVYTLKVTLHYNKSDSVSFMATTWEDATSIKEPVAG